MLFDELYNTPSEKKQGLREEILNEIGNELCVLEMANDGKLSKAAAGPLSSLISDIESTCKDLSTFYKEYEGTNLTLDALQGNEIHDLDKDLRIVITAGRMFSKRYYVLNLLREQQV